MKLVKEHINFERGLDPKDAMQTGDVLFRKREKIKEELRKAVEILVYDLQISPMSVSENFDGESTEIEFKGLMYTSTKMRLCIYYIGWDHSYYTGFAYPDGHTSSGHYDTIEEAVNKIRWWCGSFNC